MTRVQRCTMCGLDAVAAGELLAGVDGRLCAGCTAAAAVHFELSPARVPVLARALGDLLTELPARTPFDVSIPLIEAAIALAAGDPEYLRWLAYRAADLSLLELAAGALERIGAARGPMDVINAAYHDFLAGDVRRGVDRLRGLAPGDLDDHERIYLLLNRAALTLEDDATPAALDQAEADLQTVTTLVETRGPWRAGEERRNLRGAVVLGRGRVALGRGDARGAVELLRAAIDEHDDDRPFVRVLLGDALAAAGLPDEARVAWARAADDAHPESIHAEQARARLSTPYR